MVRSGMSLLSTSTNDNQNSSKISRMSSASKRRSTTPATSAPNKIPDHILIPLLAQKSFHLPGNTWYQDWKQWMCNNHIVFGICLCHKLHPVEWWERIIVLVGSMSFALMAINIYYLLWVLDDVVVNQEGQDDGVSGFDPDAELYTVPFFGTSYVVTQGTIVLWTFGGLLHSIWDFTVWQTSACACCHPGGRCYDRCSYCSRNCNDLGSCLLIPSVLGIMALAIYSSYLRFNHTNDTEVANGADFYDQFTGGALGQFSFLVKYVVELFLAWFFFFPIFGTVMFSGILGCGGRLPILGGRPRDKAMVEKSLAAASARPNGEGFYSRI